ncbi:MAG: HD domain-containing protein [Chloroflexi bacterium]|nr:HD domain-containing protein [Chloroflexota bacterium]
MDQTRTSAAISQLLASPPIPALAAAFGAADRDLYVVGGSVRDLLLGHPPLDLDFTTNARPAEVKRLLTRARADHIFAVGERFGTIGGVFGEHVVEITTYRSEAYEAGSRKPQVEFGDSLDGDLSRRDFTINAMAIHADSGDLVDPFSGREDLGARLVRAVGSPADRFRDDPLRLMRAVRFASRLAFQIEPQTRQAIPPVAEALATISRERVAQELTKILTSRLPGLGLRLLTDLGLMQYIIPEVLAMRGMTQDASYHHKDVYDHTMQVVDQTPNRLTVRWAALLHDIAKPRTRSVENGIVHFLGHETVGAQMAKKILNGLRLDKETIECVSLLVAMHQRANAYEDDWTDGAVRRFVREAGDVLEDLLDLSAADVTSKRPERQRAASWRVSALRERIERLREEEEIEKLASPLDGVELMAMFERPPGPWIRGVKDRLLAAVLDGQLAPDDKEGAAAMARAFVSDAAEA